MGVMAMGTWRPPLVVMSIVSWALAGATTRQAARRRSARSERRASREG
jgi:hypothetical protein